MAKKEEKSLEIPKQEVIKSDEMERTRDRNCFIPKTDIYETEDEIILIADVPGADQDSVDITLEKNILSINAFVDNDIPAGYDRIYSEYEGGDFQRSFRLSDEINQNNIKAVVNNGELRLHLPKAEPAKTKKIKVEAV
jgi:HSP20 family molecular chaperone IbpA